MLAHVKQKLGLGRGRSRTAGTGPVVYLRMNLERDRRDAVSGPGDSRKPTNGHAIAWSEWKRPTSPHDRAAISWIVVVMKMSDVDATKRP